MEVKKMGNIYGFTGGCYAGNVYDDNGLAPNFNGMEGGNRQPMIVIGSTQRNAFIGNGDYSPTLNSAMGMGGGQTPMIIEDFYKNRDERIYKETAPTIRSDRTGLKTIVAMRGRNPENPSDRRAGIELEQRLEPQKEGICNTLTSVCKDNLVVEQCKYVGNINPSGRGMGGEVTDTNGISRTLTVGHSEPNKILIRQATDKGYIECKIGGVADLSFPNSNTRRGRVQDGGDVSPGLTVSGVDGICRIEERTSIYDEKANVYPAEFDDGSPAYTADPKIESPYRIRKLTPLECWRLMGFSDEEFHKAEAVNSNTQLYKQAGNSIVVDVLQYIFKEIIEVMEEEEMKKIEEVKTVKFETDKMIDLAKLQETEPELFEELAADYPCEDATYIFKVQSVG